ncbi:MAG: NAD(P)/FAD-dependent oxidoreductase [bacterium]
MKTSDVIIVGAGSIGLPTSLFLAERKISVTVIDELPSFGQGQNKSAIGGVRATHSDAAKIKICLMSLEILGTWRQTYGDDIHFQRGGYCFPVYREEDEESLKSLLAMQRGHGLKIDWLDANGIRDLLPGINPDGLRGGTYSPDDGNVSPILTARAFYNQAIRCGVRFVFMEKVVGISLRSTGVEIRTNKDSYSCGKFLNAAGASASEVGRLMGLELPVEPDCHEGGVTEPVKKFFNPLVVDIREMEGSKNFYFYQEQGGHLVFCLTPDPPIIGTNRESTSYFLPMAAQRLISIFPRLRHLRVRRTWRGLYPMTADGVPIVDKVDNNGRLYVAVGFCGQGLMLGPGVAKNLVSLMIDGKPLVDEQVFSSFAMRRDFGRKAELLK